MSLRAPGARVAAPTPTPELAAAQGLIPHAGLANHASPGGPGGSGGSPNAPPQPIPQIATLRSDQVIPIPNAAHNAEPCPRCSEKNPDGSRFCHSCGLALSPAQGGKPPVPPPMHTPPPQPTPQPAPPQNVAPPSSEPRASVVCGRCRGVADPGADFCKFCGARLNAAASVPRIAAQPAPHDEVSAPPPMAAPPSAPAASSLPGPDPGSAPRAPVRPPHVGGDATVRARLVRIAKDGSEGAQHPITGDVTDIGRSEGAIVLADDPYLSPRHARISIRPAQQGEEPHARPSLVLVDLGSVNGVFVRLRAAYPLTHGDLLLLGQQVLRFEAVTELEGARGPAMQHGVLLFGSPAPVSRARLQQRTVEGLVRDVMYLVRDEFVVGREVGDRTYPEDVFMSRRHATFRREGAGHVLQDLGSSNGTFVQVHGEHMLQDGDQFRIGHHLFRVDVPAPAGTS